jgi:NADH:ubiquinone oxidoreductase subunit 2 (subunit N)
MLGLVLLGGAPFHFWASDLFQGARPWIPPIAVVSLQLAGAGWLERRIAGIERFPDAASAAESLLGAAALAGFVVGAATLVFQRRPERRIGTLASLNGTLALSMLVAGLGGGVAGPDAAPGPDAAERAVFLGAWSVHLVLALTAAGIVTRFLPVSHGPATAPVLLRRHPWAGIAGLYATLSLAGAPGTPGAAIWGEAAAALVTRGQAWLTLGIAMAWISAFAVAVRQIREAFGVHVPLPPPERDVPWRARAAIWACALGLVALLVVGR